MPSQLCRLFLSWPQTKNKQKPHTPTIIQSQDKETWTFDKSQHGKSFRRRDGIETKWHMQKKNLAVGKKCHQG